MKQSILVFLLCVAAQTILAQDSLSIFAFGNSLIDHRPPLNPTPSDETTIAHWLRLLAIADDKELAMGGQYGFLPQHQNVPPISQWGYDIVPGVWESDTESFSASSINTILLTGGNFIQYQGPEIPYYTDPDITPLSATRTIFDWVIQQKPLASLYLYESWPDMAGYLSNGFPPSANEWKAYQDYTDAAYHDWWLSYQDVLVDSRPNLTIRMIPVGQILTLLQQGILRDSLTAVDWYEDDAPHGTPNTYFIAALSTYIALMHSDHPEQFNFPTTLHPAIANNYNEIVAEIINYYNDFNFVDGLSRVYRFADVSNTNDQAPTSKLALYPNPAKGHLIINMEPPTSKIKTVEIRDVTGRLVAQHLTQAAGKIRIDISALKRGVHTITIGGATSSFTKL